MTWLYKVSIECLLYSVRFCHNKLYDIEHLLILLEPWEFSTHTYPVVVLCIASWNFALIMQSLMFNQKFETSKQISIPLSLHMFYLYAILSHKFQLSQTPCTQIYVFLIWWDFHALLRFPLPMLGHDTQVEIQANSKTYLICSPFLKDQNSALSVVHNLKSIVFYFLVVNSTSLALVTKSCLKIKFFL